jgi:gliding motility-associated-like protein
MNCFTDTAYVTIGVGGKPTLDLGPDKTVSTGTQFPLVSTIVNGPITQWLWTPSTNLSCSTCAVPIATVKDSVMYSVTATTAYGCVVKDSIRIKTFCESTQVFIPNLFTPDGDGLNDVLMVRGTGIRTIKSFRIFNRWGELVFERSNFSPNEKSSGWDGKIRGVPASPDVYVYTCEVVCDNNIPYVYKGNVTLIK